ncbi:MAG TPA: hypothetical protein VMN78_09745 [Longimicrobiales bacterium]|nr:hypothetical protein [Longimicrobiales bacterium]
MRHSPVLPGLLLLAVAHAAPVRAQEHGDHAESSDHEARARAGADAPASQPKPARWLIRLDRPDRGSADDVMFTEMSPGWHVTTGPAVILHHPASSANGEYRLESEMFLFDPGERREGYGVFFGGVDLEGDRQRYTYFLLRRDGRYLIKTRSGAETAVVRDWTEHPAIIGWESKPADAGTAHNTIAVDVGPAHVSFLVNGTEVDRLGRTELPATDGIFGLRVNHGLNLHVTSVGATP